MRALHDARAVIAAAVTGPGMPCLPYPPENLDAPLGYVDTLDLTYDAPASFCRDTEVEAVVLLVAQRHDLPGATEGLEGRIGPAVEALEGIPGARVTGVSSGSVRVGGSELPAVSFTVRFTVTR